MKSPRTTALLVVPFLALAAGPAAAQGPVAPGSVPATEDTDAQPASDPAPARMLRMRNGSILWGSILDHDQESLSFRRLDNGGTVHLPWSLLDPQEEEGLRLTFGYVESSIEEMMIDADRILLVDGTEIVGRITDRTATDMWVKTAQDFLPIPLGRIAGSTIVKVPALDIYSREELYQQKARELQDALLQEGPAAAPAHFELAQFSEQLFDYIHAVEHYEAVQRLDPDYEAETLGTILARARTKAELQNQVDHLQEIDLWRARKQYARALELIASFPELYPDTELMEDFAKVRERVRKSQERDLRDEVVRSWNSWTRRLAQKAARRFDTYEETLNYLDATMGEDVVAAVQEDMQRIAPDIQQDEVRALFFERKGGRFRQASYGLGTWLLGEDRARAGLEKKEEGDEPEKGSAEEARRQIEDKIKRYLKNQELARKAKASGTSEEDDPETFWKTFPSGNRSQWILAYYVENSGDYTLEKIRFRNCRECGGTGARHVVFTGGAANRNNSGERLVPCPSCRSIGVIRMVRYR